MPFLARTHPRLSAAAVLGLAAGILIPAETLISKILIGWNAGVWTYLMLMLWLTSRAKAEDVKRIAEVEDENAGLVLFMVCIAAIASLATITFELAGSKELATGQAVALRFHRADGHRLMAADRGDFQRALRPALLHLGWQGAWRCVSPKGCPRPTTGTSCTSPSPSAWRCRPRMSAWRPGHAQNRTGAVVDRLSVQHRDTGILDQYRGGAFADD